MIPKELDRHFDLRVDRETLHRAPTEKYVTVRDLINSGVVSVKIGDKIVKSVSGAPTIQFAAQESTTGAYSDLTIPPAPSGVVSASGAMLVRVSWDAAIFSNFSHSELWRSDAEAGTKTLIGTSVAPVFVDLPGDAIERFYWVRHVSLARLNGGFSAFVQEAASLYVGDDIADRSIDAGNVDDGAIPRSSLTEIPSTKIANAAFGSAQFDVGAIGYGAIENLAVNDLHVINTANFVSGTLIDDASIDRATVNRFVVKHADIATLDELSGHYYGFPGGGMDANLYPISTIIDFLAVNTLKIAGSALTNLSTTLWTNPGHISGGSFVHLHSRVPAPPLAIQFGMAEVAKGWTPVHSFIILTTKGGNTVSSRKLALTISVNNFNTAPYYWSPSAVQTDQVDYLLSSDFGYSSSGAQTFVHYICNGYTFDCPLLSETRVDPNAWDDIASLRIITFDIAQGYIHGF